MNTELTIVAKEGRFFLRLAPTYEDGVVFPIYPLADVDAEMIVTSLTKCTSCYVSCNFDGEIGVTVNFPQAVGLGVVNGILDLFGATVSQAEVAFSVKDSDFIRCKILLFPSDNVPF